MIFNGFGFRTAEHGEIIDGLQGTYPDTPLAVEATRPRAAHNANRLEGCTLCPTPLTRRRLVETVDRAWRSRQEPEDLIAE